MKILVADTDGAPARELSARLLAEHDAFSVTLCRAGETLLDAVGRARPDVVIVDMARPDRDGLDSIRALNAQEMLPIVMFVDVDDPAFMEAAIEAGVSSYHIGERALAEIKPVLRTAVAVFGRMRALAGRLSAAEAQLAARHTIEAAKRLLMAQDKMSEPAAHRYLQRRAMESQKKLREIASAVIVERTVKGTAKDD